MKIYIKSILKLIKSNLSRFITIVLIVMLGVGFLVGLFSVAPDLQVTASKFINDQKTSEVYIKSTTGFFASDVEMIKDSYQENGLKAIRSTYETDDYVNLNTSTGATKLAKLVYEDEHTDQDAYVLLEGRMPTNKNEVLVEQSGNYLKAADLNSKIYVDDNEYTVVGIVNNPWYIMKERYNSDQLQASLDMVIYLQMDALYNPLYVKEKRIYTNVYCYFGYNGNAFSKAIKDKTKILTDKIDNASSQIISNNQSNINEYIRDKVLVEALKEVYSDKAELEKIVADEIAIEAAKESVANKAKLTEAIRDKIVVEAAKEIIGDEAKLKELLRDGITVEAAKKLVGNEADLKKLLTDGMTVEAAKKLVGNEADLKKLLTDGMTVEAAKKLVGNEADLKKLLTDGITVEAAKKLVGNEADLKKLLTDGMTVEAAKKLVGNKDDLTQLIVKNLILGFNTSLTPEEYDRRYDADEILMNALPPYIPFDVKRSNLNELLTTEGIVKSIVDAQVNQNYIPAEEIEAKYKNGEVILKKDFVKTTYDITKDTASAFINDTPELKTEFDNKFSKFYIPSENIEAKYDNGEVVLYGEMLDLSYDVTKNTAASFINDTNELKTEFDNKFTKYYIPSENIEAKYDNGEVVLYGEMLDLSYDVTKNTASAFINDTNELKTEFTDKFTKYYIPSENIEAKYDNGEIVLYGEMLDLSYDVTKNTAFNFINDTSELNTKFIEKYNKYYIPSADIEAKYDNGEDIMLGEMLDLSYNINKNTAMDFINSEEELLDELNTNFNKYYINPADLDDLYDSGATIIPADLIDKDYDLSKATIRRYINEDPEILVEFNDAIADLYLTESEIERRYYAGEVVLKKDQIDKDYDLSYATADLFINDTKEIKDELDKQILEFNEDNEYKILPFSRLDNLSFKLYDMYVEKIADIALVFPIFFFIITSLVTLTSLRRLIYEERSTIGTLRGLGFSRLKVSIRYMIYGILAAAIGSLLGIGLGIALIPLVIYMAYKTTCHMPPLIYDYNYLFITLVVLGMIALIILVIYLTLRSTLKESPASLLIPKAPPAGKRIFLERIKFIWNRLSFKYKSTIRNMIRYKRNLLMMLIGVGGCAALVLVAFGINNSIDAIGNRQFNEIVTYDGLAKLDKPGEITDSRITDKDYIYYDELDIDDYIVKLIISDEATNTYFNLHSKNNPNLKLDENSVVISEQIAKVKKLKIGDTLSIEKKNQSYEFTITDICENYVDNYYFIGKNNLGSNISEFSPNYLMFKTIDLDSKEEEALGRSLIDLNLCSQIVFTSAVSSAYMTLVDNMHLIVIVVILFAAILAFVVIFNLMNINISEREREIATLKVLGYHTNEVHGYISRETFILTLLGIGVGIGIGYGLHQFIAMVIDTNGIFAGRYITWQSYIYTILITLGFAIIVDLCFIPHYKRISMVESLKAIE